MGNFAKTGSHTSAMPSTTGLGESINKVFTEPALVHCDVVFGSPRSDCSGAGICKIVDISSRQYILLKRSCRLAPALLTANAAGNVLTMTFLREFMCVHLLRHHFRTGVLDVQEACPIPDRVANHLGLCGETIVPGNYPIEEINRGFIIYFPV
jgi:hypothetical protein